MVLAVVKTMNHILVSQKFILDTFVCRSQVDVIYTEFSKAFDKVNYSIPYLSKLHNIGIRGPFLF